MYFYMLPLVQRVILPQPAQTFDFSLVLFFHCFLTRCCLFLHITQTIAQMFVFLRNTGLCGVMGQRVSSLGPLQYAQEDYFNISRMLKMRLMPKDRWADLYREHTVCDLTKFKKCCSSNVLSDMKY